MRDNKSSAVLVLDEQRLIGIFTTKDIVLRVLASSLDPTTTTVIRVQTPHPDTVQVDTTMLDALRKMHGALTSPHSSRGRPQTRRQRATICTCR